MGQDEGQQRHLSRLARDGDAGDQQEELLVAPDRHPTFSMTSGADLHLTAELRTRGFRSLCPATLKGIAVQFYVLPRRPVARSASDGKGGRGA